MRIGALAERSGVSAKTLRFYEQAGLLVEPQRTSAGYRDYPPATVNRVLFIRAAQTAGLRLAEIADVLAIRDSGSAPCAHVRALVDTHLAEVRARLADLRRTERELRRLSERAAAQDPAACTDAEICAILGGGS
ncbi:heavy metal-responsive transcriptional regulator [Nocardia terpenica]|uniref:MerR family DNA-binding protein n=1 Tax=Nocardia terpenica TaxID=455432 RepID=A0A6G9YYX1_9NOCA|nr:heavy metal-responsive transcriptional regulator [Nocardia terpenica]QIS18186.1 MerR family DNA-binding protein [Nocardia terpenica]